jgi:hypothetical protein
MKRLSEEVNQDIKALLTANMADWKREAVQIGRDYEDEYGEDLNEGHDYMELTVATNDEGDQFNYQTGCNSFTGGCYSLRHWAVTGIHEDTEIDELHDEIVNELESLLPDNR